VSRLTVLFAPDSFKGSLTSVQVTRALADGWSRARPDDTLEHAPLGDGGEGSIHAIAFAGGWDWIQARVSGPLGDEVNAGWLRSVDGLRAFVELAEASGLSRVESGRRDPIRASTRGTGELVQKALDAGVERIIVGIGGSATTDGGAGLLRGLGAVADRDAGVADFSGLDPRLARVDLAVACDVSNPLRRTRVVVSRFTSPTDPS
jgi:glycerate kinase